MLLLGQHTASETSTYLADEEIEEVNSPDSYELRWRMMTEGLKAAQSGEQPAHRREKTTQPVQTLRRGRNKMPLRGL